VVSFNGTTYNDLPYKFEAGTPNISAIIAWNAAFDYINSLGVDNILAYESELLEYGTKKISEIDGLSLIGTAKNKASILSFVLEGIHPHDLASFTDKAGVAIRTGHHCTQPVMKRMNVPATSRASLSIYNTKEDIDILVESLKKAQELFL
jgi:cysteine desulfurase/selenocysteine lyase